jgi:hypothetical protein
MGTEISCEIRRLDRNLQTGFERGLPPRAHSHTAPAEAPRRGGAYGVRQPSQAGEVWKSPSIGQTYGYAHQAAV